MRKKYSSSVSFFNTWGYCSFSGCIYSNHIKFGLSGILAPLSVVLEPTNWSIPDEYKVTRPDEGGISPEVATSTGCLAAHKWRILETKNVIEVIVWFENLQPTQGYIEYHIDLNQPTGSSSQQDHIIPLLSADFPSIVPRELSANCPCLPHYIV